MNGALSLRRLSDLEAVIERGLETFIEVGRALLEINEQRLYRTIGYSTFENYCQERWQMSRKRAYDMLAAASVVNVIEGAAEMSPIGDITDETAFEPTPALPIPANEAQARELARLHDPAPIREVWQSVVEEHGPQITAKAVRDAVDERLGRKQAREEAEAQHERDVEHQEAIFSLVRDPAREREERLAGECVLAMKEMRQLLRRIDPSLHVPMIDKHERPSLEELVRDVRIWASRIEAELRQPLRLVTERNDDDE